jgi:hypothetical protein
MAKDKVKKGDIVHVNPEKYPELAWGYYEIQDVIISKVDLLKIQAFQLKAKTGKGKKAKKDKNY